MSKRGFWKKKRIGVMLSDGMNSVLTTDYTEKKMSRERAIEILEQAKYDAEDCDFDDEKIEVYQIAIANALKEI